MHFFTSSSLCPFAYDLPSSSLVAYDFASLKIVEVDSFPFCLEINALLNFTYDELLRVLVA